MSMLKEMDPRFINLEKKVGLFTLVAFLATLAIIAFVAAQQGLFAPRSRLTFVADSGKELRQGMAVKFSGFRIGKVTKLTLSAWANVNATMAIDKRYMKWIRSDSSALLVHEGVLGEPVIEITPGSPMYAELAEDESIPFERRAGLNDMLAQLDDLKLLLVEVRQGRIGETLANANQVSAEFLATRQHVDAFLDAAQQTFGRLDRVLGHADDTIGHTDQTVGRTDALIGQMEGTAGHLDQVVTTTQEVLPALLARTEALLTRMEDAGVHLAEAAANAPALATKSDALADEARATLAQTRALLTAIGDVWPIRSHLKQKNGE
jgi:phospholipid/cholesterol/gamma-HCH transport system substrate-binding protein